MSAQPRTPRHASFLAYRNAIGRATNDCDDVLNHLLVAGPQTDEEIADGTGIPLKTVNARRRDLVLEGLVVPSGVYRPAKSGNNVTVWRVIDNPATAIPIQKISLTRDEATLALRELNAIDSTFRKYGETLSPGLVHLQQWLHYFVTYR